MSDRPDSSERTEEPTAKKIEDALKKGQTPFSREAPTFASLLGLLVVLGLLISEQTRVFVSDLARIHDNAGGYALEDGTDVTALFLNVYRASAIFVLPIVILLAIFGVIAALAQSPPSIVAERVRPKLERISLVAGAKRIFGSPGIAEFLRSLFKFAVVGTIAVTLLAGEIPHVVRAVFVDPTLLPAQILSIATRLLAVVCATTIILVAADLVWTRFKWKRDLKMTRREVKDELKQSEGDPILRARIRSAQKDRSRRRMLTAVPKATVVIANPTHFAVALLYARGAGGAPRLVAKGADLVALRIREIADENGVPIVENPPLARALYHAVEVERHIPEEFYRAVAEVLYYVYARSDPAGGRRPPHTPA
ncbi:flagellar biosynthesis protein FlhB [Acuticoccus kandeliae]|uniref:flagellar biosynthesis protein FlhB n=1 Tax=Acuticoccus kandeliae TaxID=2073160 RepID=UPI000D3E5C33|nr:flagellar biosynthesis protein FlhB [Acuticoccus kandeliae]